MLSLLTHSEVITVLDHQLAVAPFFFFAHMQREHAYTVSASVSDLIRLLPPSFLLSPGRELTRTRVVSTKFSKDGSYVEADVLLLFLFLL